MTQFSFAVDLPLQIAFIEVHGSGSRKFNGISCCLLKGESICPDNKQTILNPIVVFMCYIVIKNCRSFSCCWCSDCSCVTVHTYILCGPFGAVFLLPFVVTFNIYEFMQKYWCYSLFLGQLVVVYLYYVLKHLNFWNFPMSWCGALASFVWDSWPLCVEMNWNIILALESYSKS